MNEPATPILELRDATKSYGAVRALREGDLSLRPGEVRALIGENGAGKSTLVKVLGGVVRRDTGEMLRRRRAGRLPRRTTRATPASPSSTRSRRCSRT